MSKKKKRILKFEIEPMGEMSIDEAIEYYKRWVNFMEKVANYGESIDMLMKALKFGLKKEMK
jgi:hypothetical protein